MDPDAVESEEGGGCGLVLKEAECLDVDCTKGRQSRLVDGSLAESREVRAEVFTEDVVTFLTVILLLDAVVSLAAADFVDVDVFDLALPFPVFKDLVEPDFRGSSSSVSPSVRFLFDDLISALIDLMATAAGTESFGSLCNIDG